jgi:hypothetical protein
VLFVRQALGTLLTTETEKGMINNFSELSQEVILFTFQEPQGIPESKFSCFHKIYSLALFLNHLKILVTAKTVSLQVLTELHSSEASWRLGVLYSFTLPSFT